MNQKWVYVDAAVRNLGKLRKELTEKQLNACISKAINRSLKDGVQEARSAVSDTYNIPNSYLTKIKAVLANKDTLTGGITADKKPLPLHLFKPQFQFPTASKKSGAKKRTRKKSGNGKSNSNASATSTGLGVSVEVHKGKRKTIPYAFMLRGIQGVFARGKYRKGGKYGFIRRHKRIKKDGPDLPITSLLTMTVNAASMHHGANLARIKRVAREGLKKYLMEEVKAKIEKLSR